jgi:DNA-binding transcriptional LysR family regulator
MAELGVVELVGIRLVMVTTHAGIQPNAALARDDYVLVDWGTGFANAHAQAFGGAPPPRLRIGLGRLAHDFLRDHGGSAYLPEAMVADDLGAGRLLQVAGAPLMERATYAFHHRDANRNGRFDALLATLRRT